MMSFLGSGSDVSLGLLIGKKIIFFVVIAVAGWFVVPRFMKLLERINVIEPVITMALVVCFAFADFADLMGMSVLLASEYLTSVVILVILRPYLPLSC